MTHPSDLRVLVLGATGMLGHKVWQLFRRRFDAYAGVRDAERYAHTGLFDGGRVAAGVRAGEFASVERAIADARPDVIVNCIGIVKQLKAAGDAVPSITINALFPHQLAEVGRTIGARVIHISTDCVFLGSRGGYTEQDVPDAEDLYGRTKLLGEVAGPGCLTVRTSIVGRELSATTGLLEWFLAQQGNRIRGYTTATFSGLTTSALAELLGDVIEHHPALSGLYHVASAPISKYDLLVKFNQAFRASIAIEPSDEVRIDRTLDGSRFTAATGLTCGGWDAMVAALAADPTPYDDWRMTRV
jgi:dTDP-4-dehydrorhamnose reductase